MYAWQLSFLEVVSKKRLWLYLLSTLICLTNSLSALALDPARKLNEYGLDLWQEGLPQQAVLSIAQTPDGYLWFGTYEGLARFNGAQFTVYNRRNTPELTSNAIWTMLTASDGTLWIGTLGGGLVSYRDGQFKAITKRDGLASDVVYALIAAADGTLWIGTEGGVSSRAPDGKLQTYPLVNLTVRSLCLDRSGTLWVGTEGSGVMHLRDGKFTKFAESRLGTTIYSMLETQDGSIWLADYGYGLVRWRAGQLKRYEPENGLPDRLVWTLYEDRHRELWVGFDGAGMARVRHGAFEVFSTKGGLSQGFVRSIFEDHEGSLWLGTSGGLNRLRDTKVRVFSSAQGLSHDVVRSICATKDGTLWFGTDGGGVTALKPDGAIQVFNVANGRLPHDSVRAVWPADDGVWVGTNGGGLALINSAKTVVYNTQHGLTTNNVYALSQDAGGTLWIGTYGGGLNRLRKDGTIAVYTTAQGLSQNTIRCLLPDGEGGVWIGTNGGGLSRLNKEGVFRAWRREDGLASEVVLALYQEKDGTLWIGTDTGLTRLRDGVLKTITAEQGLHDDKIFQILPDSDGNFWMSCNRGIFRVARQELEEVLEGRRSSVSSVVYGKAEGMKTPQCNGASWPAGWATPEGVLWFPTNKGAVRVEPRRLFFNPIAPPVQIERVRLENRWLDLKSVPELVRSDGNLEVHYAALSYRVPEYVRFRYILEGYDRQWTDAGTRREAFYTNLPARSYQFRVQACNDDGVWNETGAALNFILIPPVWQRWWAITIYFLIGVSMVYYGVKWRMRSLELKAAELERVVASRTQEIAHQRDEIEAQRAQVLDSIHYAERIQRSMLTYREQVAHSLKEVFILFEPKDIVSGDFFWFERVGSVVVAATADCTGHGVPGALLSMVGSVLLTQIVKDGALTCPASVLERLDVALRLTLRRYADSFETEDGMEIALCCIDYDSREVVFAGARRSLYYVTRGELFEIKGARRTIGGRARLRPESFVNHRLPLSDELTLYMFSDGFTDQSDAQGKRYGNKRFKQLLQELSSKDLAQQRLGLLRALERHRGSEPQRDDITVIGIRFG